MARFPREITDQFPYHIICRVNNGEYFFEDSISKLYIEHLKRVKDRIEFDLINYSILPSHLHMIIFPKLHPINEIMHRLNSPFSKLVNKSLGRKGHFWWGRYHSVLIRTDRQYIACMRYIDRNAYSAGLALQPWEWKWSGTAHYVLGEKNDLITDASCYLSLNNVPDKRHLEYKELIQKRLPMDNLPGELRKLIRLHFSSTYRFTF